MTRPRTTYEYDAIDESSLDGLVRLQTYAVQRPVWRFGWPTRTTHVCAVDRIDDGGWEAELGSCSPWRGWVHNDGRAVVLRADDQLFVFGPDGRRVRTHNVLDLLQRDPTARERLSWSTAGVFWCDEPAGFFGGQPESIKFWLLLDWGQRLAFDADTGRPEATTCLQAPEQVEKRWALAKLAPTPDPDGPHVLRAIQIAGRHELREAEEALRALETTARVSTSRSNEVGVSASSRGPAASGVFAFWDHAVIRSAAQLALVRLGAEFEPSNAYGAVTQPRPEGWRAAVECVARGDRAIDVYQLAGAPMFEDHVGVKYVWEYDLFTAGGYQTVRLTWEGRRVASTEHVPSPRPGEITYRDGWLKGND